jgi:hypothetical protein
MKAVKLELAPVSSMPHRHARRQVSTNDRLKLWDWVSPATHIPPLFHAVGCYPAAGYDELSSLMPLRLGAAGALHPAAGAFDRPRCTRLARFGMSG